MPLACFYGQSGMAAIGHIVKIPLKTLYITMETIFALLLDLHFHGDTPKKLRQQGKAPCFCVAPDKMIVQASAPELSQPQACRSGYRP